MGYSGYRDKDSQDIFDKYQLINESDISPTSGTIAQEISGETPSTEDFFDSWAWTAITIIDPTGVLSVPEVIRSFTRWINTPQGKNSGYGVINFILFVIALLCIIPSPGIRQLIAGSWKAALKTAGKDLSKMKPEEVVRLLEGVMNTIIKNESLRATAIKGIDSLLGISKSEPGIYNVLTKIKTSLQTGKINIGELVGLSDNQFLAVREALKQSDLLIKGEKAFVIPAAGTKESEIFWQNVAQQGRAGKFGSKFVDYFKNNSWNKIGSDFWTGTKSGLNLNKAGYAKWGGRLGLSVAPETTPDPTNMDNVVLTGAAKAVGYEPPTEEKSRNKLKGLQQNLQKLQRGTNNYQSKD